MYVSSAYKSTDIGKCFNDSGRSLIKSRNKRGPKIDPCGSYALNQMFGHRLDDPLTHFQSIL